MTGRGFMNQPVDWQWLLWLVGYVVGGLLVLWVVLTVGILICYWCSRHAKFWEGKRDDR